MKALLNRIIKEQSDKEVIWDYIIDTGIATKEELRLVTNINGYNEETLNSVIYARTGYRDMEQLQDAEG